MKDMNQFDRSEKTLGKDAVEKLHGSTVAVFGLGGVGGPVCEALVRTGLGNIIIVDNDTVDITNINRQIIALHSTVGRRKTDVWEERLKDIYPDVSVVKHDLFFLPETADMIDLTGCDYIVDAVDTVAAKIELVKKGKELGIPVISSMGTGNKTETSLLEVSDIYRTSVCPLARIMRKKLRECGIKELKVVYSKEEPVKTGSRTPASVVFVPQAAGLMIAGEIVKDLTGA